MKRRKRNMKTQRKPEMKRKYLERNTISIQVSIESNLKRKPVKEERNLKKLSDSLRRASRRKKALSPSGESEMQPVLASLRREAAFMRLAASAYCGGFRTGWPVMARRKLRRLKRRRMKAGLSAGLGGWLSKAWKPVLYNGGYLCEEVSSFWLCLRERREAILF